MLHDPVMARSWGDPAEVDVMDRRDGDRLPFPGEVVIAWTHDLTRPVRYRIVDAGDGGYRIHSSLPMLEGTTGMVMRILPGRGGAIDQPVMVAWTRPSDDGAGHEIGLRCF